MFQLSRASEYAILFLANLARQKNKKTTNLQLITAKIGLPYKFLSRIVLRLKKAKIIKSKKGPSGGYFLAQEPQKISLIKIIEAVEGKKGLVVCIHNKCSLRNVCFHRQIWLKLQKSLNQELEKIKLSNLAWGAK